MKKQSRTKKGKDISDIVPATPVKNTGPDENNSPLIKNEEPEIMETPHTGRHGKGRGLKAWLYDFLMLFLAITAGFFVENQREHYLEHVREKQYARSLLEDLKVDTAIIHRVSVYKIWNSEKMDSLMKVLNAPDIHRYNEMIYYFERLMTVNDVFTAQDVTYQQLQSSGNFRYISDKELYREISDYYNLYERYREMIESNIEDPASLSEMESFLFDATDLSSLYNPDSKDIRTVYNRPDRKLSPVKNDDHYLNLLIIKASNRHDIQKSSVIWLMWLKTKAIKILAELEKEYHLN